MRALRSLLIILILLGILFYLTFGYFLSFLLGPLFLILGHDFKKAGMEFAAPKAGSVRLCAWKTICAENLILDFKIFRKNSLVANREIEMALDRVRLVVSSPENTLFQAEGLHVFIRPAMNDPSAPEDLIEGKDMTLSFALDWTSPARARKQLHRLAGDLGRLATEGRSPALVKLSATSYFTVQKIPLKADLQIEQDASGSRIFMSPEDLRILSRSLKQKLSEAEIDLLSRYPMRAAGLLRIRNDSIDTAAAQLPLPKDEDLKDAYRHVLWAYLLTRAYGDVFAREVMRAHEEGSAIPNTPAQQRMDEVNNEAGIRYAEAGYPRESLFDRLLKDPQVIRSSGAQA